VYCNILVFNILGRKPGAIVKGWGAFWTWNAILSHVFFRSDVSFWDMGLQIILKDNLRNIYIRIFSDSSKRDYVTIAIREERFSYLSVFLFLSPMLIRDKFICRLDYCGCVSFNPLDCSQSSWIKHAGAADISLFS